MEMSHAGGLSANKTTLVPVLEALALLEMQFIVQAKSDHPNQICSCAPEYQNSCFDACRTRNRGVGTGMALGTSVSVAVRESQPSRCVVLRIRKKGDSNT